MERHMAQQRQQAPDDKGDEQGMVSRLGPFEVNWPRTIGYYGWHCAGRYL